MNVWHIQTVAPVTDSALGSWGDQISGGDGLFFSPYGSFAELLANETLADDDFIYLDTETSGYPNYGAVTLIGASNLLVTQPLNGSGLQRMVNGFPLDLATLESSDGTYDVYRTVTNALTTAPKGISQNWNININEKGQRFGILEIRASAAELKTLYGYYYAANTLYVSIPSGADIADYEHIVGLAEHTLMLVDCPDATCTYLSVEHAFDPIATKGYGLRYDGVSPGGLIQFCESDGCQWHGFGSVADDPTGFKMLNNRYKTVAPSCDSQLVIYAATAGGKVDQCVIAYNTVDLDPWLGYDGQAVETPAFIVGIASHTFSGAGSTGVGGLLIHHNRTTWSGFNPTALCRDCIFIAADAQLGGQPSDVTDPSTYPIQMWENDWNGHGINVGGAGNKAWVSSVRDSWYLDTEDVTSSLGTGGLIGVTSSSSSSDCGLLLNACTISGDTTKFSSGNALLAAWGSNSFGGTLTLINCSVHMRGVGHPGGTRIINFSTSSGPFLADGNIFSCEQVGIRLTTGAWDNSFVDSDAINAGWNNNWYDPNLFTRFSTGSTSNSRSIFQSDVDPTGEYSQAIVFEDDGTLEPSTATHTLKNASKPIGPDGINLNDGSGLGVYDETYGAWQFGSPPSGSANIIRAALPSLARTGIASRSLSRSIRDTN